MGTSRNLVITGIPRSGTSYACTLLNNIENTVVVNEPEEIFQILRNGSTSSLSDWYVYTRRCINNGIPIQNKIINGKYIEDTNKGDVRSFYTPDVNDESFVFGTKNTLVYLASLHKLRENLPDATIIAFIRHPHDCISSWKRVRFPHIRNAAPLFLKDYTGEADGSEIVRICRHPELESRYAMLWNFLAMRILKYSDRLTVYRYEDFVVQPEHLLSGLYESLGSQMQAKEVIVPSAPRKHEDSLSARELECIREHCSAAAAGFDYSL